MVFLDSQGVAACDCTSIGVDALACAEGVPTKQVSTGFTRRFAGASAAAGPCTSPGAGGFARGT